MTNELKALLEAAVNEAGDKSLLVCAVFNPEEKNLMFFQNAVDTNEDLAELLTSFSSIAAENAGVTTYKKIPQPN